MKQFWKIILSITLIIFSIIKCDVLYAQSELPDSWQPGMTLLFIHGSGMRPESSELIISDTSCFKIEKGLKSEIKTMYHLTRKNLNAILEVLRKNCFENLKAEKKGFAYDKPTNSYLLKWNGKITGIITSADMDIIEADRYKLANILADIYKIINKK